jgi:hypothetical protein
VYSRIKSSAEGGASFGEGAGCASNGMTFTWPWPVKVVRLNIADESVRMQMFSMKSAGRVSEHEESDAGGFSHRGEMQPLSSGYSIDMMN